MLWLAMSGWTAWLTRLLAVTVLLPRLGCRRAQGDLAAVADSTRHT